jgi:hypothetical protein
MFVFHSYNIVRLPDIDEGGKNSLRQFLEKNCKKSVIYAKGGGIPESLPGMDEELQT